ncbi:MAG: hypothetical protein KY476_04020 [Planctomycetes bacterium]|nr:hypothetical protein [Planctomycetota bacterium]
MRRHRLSWPWSAAALVLAATLVLASPISAQDEKPADSKPAAEAPDQPAEKEQPKPDAPKQDAEQPEKSEPKEDAPERPKEDAPKSDEAPAEQDGVTSKVRVTNLDNPCGVLVHPKTGHVFITSKYGIYRYQPAEKDRTKKITLDILTWSADGSKTDKYGKGPIYEIGPLGLAVLEDGNLLVGGGGKVDSEELMYVYEVADTPPEEPLQDDTATAVLGPIPKGDASTTGEGNFYAIAVGAGGAYISSNGDDTKGWVLRIPIGEDGKPGALETYLATKEAVGVDAPVGITFSPDGKELVVGQMGEVNVPGDSLLTKYNPETKELTLKLETGLSDIAGLAYSPSGKLYAVDFAWAEPQNGGLFRLDIEGEGEEQKVTATKILALDKPTALAFDKEGKLYVTIIGTAEEGSDKSPGQLILIEGDF